MTYKQVVVTRAGGPEVLQVVEKDLPEPGAGEVRLRTLAAGVSFADLLMREGVHPETPSAPFTLGWDVAGVVDKLGEGVTRDLLGRTVVALTITGGYSEALCLPASQLARVPAGVDPFEAVSLVLNYVTAYQMLHRVAQVTIGQRILVHAAAGGVGTALLQLGQQAHLEMFGTAKSEKHELVASLGATPIDYKHQDVVQTVKQLTGDGVDVDFDGIGGRHLWLSYRAARPRGLVVAYGLTSSLRLGSLASGMRYRFRGLPSHAFDVTASRLLPNRKRIVLYSIQTYKRHKPAWFREDLCMLLRWLAEGKIKPIIAAQFPLVEAAKAHELLGRGGVSGKVVLIA